MKFVVDGMLGSLAVKLRIFGIDTEYYVQIDDKTILEIANRNCRTLITSDRLLAQMASRQNISCLLINEKDDETRLITIFSKYKKKFGKIDSIISRCPKCNKIVTKVKMNEVEDLVPKKVLLNNKIFFKCKICGKIYWRGSHWFRLNELINRINTKLNTSSN